MSHGISANNLSNIVIKYIKLYLFTFYNFFILVCTWTIPIRNGLRLPMWKVCVHVELTNNQWCEATNAVHVFAQGTVYNYASPYECIIIETDSHESRLLKSFISDLWEVKASRQKWCSGQWSAPTAIIPQQRQVQIRLKIAIIAAEGAPPQLNMYHLQHFPVQVSWLFI